MNTNRTILPQNEIQQFKTFLSLEMGSSPKKLNGNQMSKLKKSHFNQYIKKIKYYAKKDIDKIKENNMRQFYGIHTQKNYQQKQSPNFIVKKQKPSPNPLTNQPSVYYYGKPQISSMREFVFLAQQCQRIQEVMNRIAQKKNNQFFIKNVQQKIQFQRGSSKSLNLRLTLKTAKQIDEKIKMKQFSPIKTARSSFFQIKNRSKSLAQTNFTFNRNNSVSSAQLILHRK